MVRKLITWRQWVLAISALVAGAGYHLFQRCKARHCVERSEIVTTMIAFCIGLAIVIALFIYANRPERGEKP
jgi:hypothetical protein